LLQRERLIPGGFESLGRGACHLEVNRQAERATPDLRIGTSVKRRVELRPSRGSIHPLSAKLLEQRAQENWLNLRLLRGLKKGQSRRKLPGAPIRGEPPHDPRHEVSSGEGCLPLV